jgi:hypothetical protein
MTKTLNNAKVESVEKQKNSKAKLAFVGMLMAGTLMVGCNQKPADIIVNLPENKVEEKEKQECEECPVCEEKEEEKKGLMYCPDLNQITVPSYNSNYDTVNLGETAVLDNGTKVEVVDLTMDGEVILKLKSNYTGNEDRTKTIKLKEGDLIEVIDEMGTSMLEVCSVNNGYTLSEKSVLLASDGAVNKNVVEEEESTCTLGQETSESHESVMENNVQRIYNTWKQVENCEYPLDKVIVKSESVFDNVIQYGEGEYSISAYTPKLNLGESLELGDGNKLVLADLKSATEQDPVDKAIISIENAQGEEITVKAIETGITEIFADGNRYIIEIKDIVPGFTLNEKYISEVKILNEKEELRRDTIHVMNPDEQWLLGGVGRYSITLYKESQYNSNLRLNETMELGDGNKVKLSDVMATLGSSPVAIISIQDKDNNLLVTTTLTKGVDIVTVGEKKYKFKTYKVNMDSQLNDVYLEVALVGDEVELNAGSYVNQQNIEITTTIQNSNFGIKGWTFDMKYLDFEN